MRISDWSSDVCSYDLPHYVAAMPYPGASLALLEATNRLAGLNLPVGDLPARAATTQTRLDELIVQNPEHLAMLHQLEEQADDHATTVELSATSGDQIAAEPERRSEERRGGKEGVSTGRSRWSADQ